MQIDRLADVQDARITAERLYQEFLRQPSMSAGLYELPAASIDPQQPHTQAELYHVIAGRADFECAGERRAVGPGDTIFVEARTPHKFVDIAKDLSILVVFAPPQSS